MESGHHQAATPFTRLGDLARAVGTGEVSRAVDAIGEHRAAEAFAKSRNSSRRGTWVGVAVAMSTLAAAVTFSSLRSPQDSLSWTIDGSTSSDASYVIPVEGREALVHFSEESELFVLPGSRLRIVDSRHPSVKAVLETGTARVRLSPRSKFAWKIDVGPFSVAPSKVANVTVEWLDGERLRVRVFEGETSITGTPSPLVLHAGQQVAASVNDGTLVVGPLVEFPDAPPSDSASSATLDPVASSLPEAPLVQAAPAYGTSKHASWPDAVANGDYSRVLSDAERRGIPSVLAEAPLADLVALADAARLTGRLDLAKRALLAQRSRFPRSGSAKDAAFFLGRIADDHKQAPSAAIPWYERYLAEAPAGTFAAEALGRRMVALSKQGGQPAAKEAAEDYLKRFPQGPHASVARDLARD